jgi:hypothetical protein
MALAKNYLWLLGTSASAVKKKGESYIFVSEKSKNKHGHNKWRNL